MTDALTLLAAALGVAPEGAAAEDSLRSRLGFCP